MSELKKISPEFLVKAKGVLRITTNDTVINSEIETLIRACQRDLIRNGITPSLVYDLEDSLIEMAVLTYLKAEFGLDNKNYDKFSFLILIFFLIGNKYKLLTKSQTVYT